MTSETFADTSVVVEESSGAWSLKVGCCCRCEESSRYTHETIVGTQKSANGQNMLVRNGCSINNK